MYKYTALTNDAQLRTHEKLRLVALDANFRKLEDTLVLAAYRG